MNFKVDGIVLTKPKDLCTLKQVNNSTIGIKDDNNINSFFDKTLECPFDCCKTIQNKTVRVINGFLFNYKIKFTNLISTVDLNNLAVGTLFINQHSFCGTLIDSTISNNSFSGTLLFMNLEPVINGHFAVKNLDFNLFNLTSDFVSCVKIINKMASSNKEYCNNVLNNNKLSFNIKKSLIRKLSIFTMINEFSEDSNSVLSYNILPSEIKIDITDSNIDDLYILEKGEFIGGNLTFSIDEFVKYRTFISVKNSNSNIKRAIINLLGNNQQISVEMSLPGTNVEINLDSREIETFYNSFPMPTVKSALISYSLNNSTIESKDFVVKEVDYDDCILYYVYNNEKKSQFYIGVSGNGTENSLYRHKILIKQIKEKVKKSKNKIRLSLASNNGSVLSGTLVIKDDGYLYLVTKDNSTNLEDALIYRVFFDDLQHI